MIVGNSDSESSLYQCKLGKHYIDPNAAIVKDPEFDSGVRNEDDEHIAFESWILAIVLRALSASLIFDTELWKSEFFIASAIARSLIICNWNWIDCNINWYLDLAFN